MSQSTRVDVVSVPSLEDTTYSARPLGKLDRRRQVISIVMGSFGPHDRGGT